MPRDGTGIALVAVRSNVRRDSPGTNGFYNKLFYILIAVLGAFALVSLLNYVRTRRRRLIILAEAERLGLMVPGMEGYVPMRERPALRKLDGWRTPDWWEVLEKQTQKRSSGGGAGVGHANGDASAGESKGKTKVAVGEDSTTASRRSSVYEDTFESPQQPPISTEAQSTTPLTSSTRPPASAAAPTIAVTDADPDFGARGELEVTSMEDLRPLALIPVPQLVSEPVKPLSPIPYFPNYVSYLKTAHDPKPPRFAPDDPDAFNCIIGEPLDVVVAVRMPRPPTQRDTPLSPDDDDAVMDEWGGLELGVASWQVVASEKQGFAVQ